MFTPLLCLALLAHLPPTAEIERSSYDLRGILPVRTEPARAIQTLPLTPQGDRDFDLFGDQESGFSADTLLDLLTQTVQPEQWEYEGRRLELRDQGRELIVEAPAPVQAEVRRFLEYVTRSTNSPIGVSVQVFQSTLDAQSGAPPVGRLKANQRSAVAELVRTAVLEPVRSFSFRLLSGVPSTRMDLVNHSYLRDYDVEIAQASSASDPIIDQYLTGVEFTIRADRSTDNSVLLSLVLRHSSSSGSPARMDARTVTRIVADRAVELDSGGVLQSPRVSFATLAGSVRLRAGESAGWLASPISSGAAAVGTYILIRVEQLPRLPEPFESGQRLLAIQDVAGAFSDGFRWPEEGGTELGFPYERVEDRYLPPALNLEPIRDRIASKMDELIYAVGNAVAEDEEVSLGLEANFVCVFGDRIPASSAMNRLIGLLPHPRGLQGISASMTRAGDPGSGSSTLFALTADVGEAFAVCGSQETYILSYSTDVANNSSMFNPNVEAIVDGWAARLSTSTGSDEVGTATLLLRTHLREESRKEHAALLAGMGGLDLPAFREGFLEGRLSGTDPVRLGGIRRPGGALGQIVVRGLD